MPTSAAFNRVFDFAKGRHVSGDSLTGFLEKDISIAGRICRVYGDSEDHYFTGLPQKCSDHESLFAILKRNGVSPQVIIDVGANLGLFTLGAHAVFPAADIFCYEPHPRAFAALALNTKPISDKVVVNNCALGDAEKSMLFYPGGPMNSNRSSGSHLMNESHWKEDHSGIIVPVSTLDAQVRSRSIPRVDFIKIDVEGFEWDVLQGSLAVIENFSPLIYLEFNSWALIALKNINPRMFLDYLGDYFAHVYRCNHDATVTKLETGEDRIEFLHENLITHGCVDDLLVSNVDVVVQ